jgi:hypothetical protein
MVRDAPLCCAPHHEGCSFRHKFLNDFNAKIFSRKLIPNASGPLILRPSRSTRGVSGGVLRCGSGAAPAGAVRSRAPGTAPGLRLRPPGAGARSSLTERRFAASRKARPGPKNRRAGAPQGEPPAREEHKAVCAFAALRSLTLMPGRARSAGAGRRMYAPSNDSELVMAGLVPAIHVFPAE